MAYASADEDRVAACLLKSLRVLPLYRVGLERLGQKAQTVTDRNGPTAVARSITKLDLTRFGNGIIFNQTSSPLSSCLQEGDQKLRGLRAESR